VFDPPEGPEGRPDPEAGETPPRPRTALLLANPKARNGGADLDALRAGGIAAESPADPDADFAEAIRAGAGRYDLVVIGGGDGTLNACAGALAETRMPFGILPLGTANDLARSLGLPTDPVEAATALASAPARAIDLGCVNGHHFFNVASVGFSADLAGELTADLKKRWGTLGYALAAYRLLRRARPFRVWMDHDGKVEKVRTFQVSVGNGRHYGGGMTVSEDARLDDGLLRFYSLEVRHWWRLLALLPALRRGTQGEATDVRAFSTREIVLRTRRPRPVNTDGELTTHTPAHITIRPDAVLVHAPVQHPPEPA
jgi:diacylglycerol kinase (ATP)